MIAIERAFDMVKVSKYIEDKTQSWFNSITEELNKLGLKYTETARAKTLASKPYTNRTWNLVSSIGFCIVFQGKVVHTYFPPAKEKVTGHKKGEKLAKKIAKEIADKNSACVVMVAGEEYGVYVQNKGFDVLKLSSKAFGKELTKILA